MQARAELIHIISSLNTFNDGGRPVGTKFVGKSSR